MQTDLVIVSEYCQKCHIDPSFIILLEEGGLIDINITTSSSIDLSYCSISALRFLICS